MWNYQQHLPAISTKHSKMNLIQISNHQFQWKVVSHISEYSDSHTTEFYYGTEEISYRKWLLFGPRVVEQKPKFAFKVYFAIDSPTLTNNEVKKYVMGAYDHWVGIEERAALLAKGQFL